MIHGLAIANLINNRNRKCRWILKILIIQNKHKTINLNHKNKYQVKEQNNNKLIANKQMAKRNSKTVNINNKYKRQSIRNRVENIQQINSCFNNTKQAKFKKKKD